MTKTLRRICGGLCLLVAGTYLLMAGSARGQVAPPDIGLRATPLLESEAAHPGSRFRVALRVELNPGYHVQSNEPAEDYLIPTVLRLEPPAGIETVGLSFPEPVTFEQGGVLELLVFEREFVIGAALDLAGDLEPGEYVIPGSLRYQACDDQACFAPKTEPVEFRVRVVPEDEPVEAARPELFADMSFDAAPASADPRTDRSADRTVAVAEADDVIERLGEFEVLATTGGYLPAEDFLEFIEAAESGEGQGGLFENRGPVAILLLTLIGGLALNLTPCVLPMIPVNLAIIGAGSQADSRGRGLALGAVYGLAMALVYGGLGLIVILTAGTFGTVNASPWFNLGIAVLFLLLGLAMFDVFTIDFSRFQPRLEGGDGSGSGSFLLAFGMGGVAALLAGACVAPVVIQVIVFASDLYARGMTMALGLPFLLGVGMALPWPVAGAGLSWLPEPGAWMVRVKQILGLLILATAAYYGYLAYEMFAQRWVDPDEVAASARELVEEGWYPTLSQGLEVAREEDKLVLVDVWATWCKNCLTMDATTMKDAAVQDALDDYVKVKFQAEDPNASPAREVMRRFEAVGLPAYAILRPPDAD